METDSSGKKYRLVHRKHSDGSDSYAIHEVYYDKQGKIIVWSHTPAIITAKGDWSQCCLIHLEMGDAFMSRMLEWDELQAL
jgi:hypothetical protein